MLNVFLRPLSVLAWGLCLALGAAAQGSDIVVGQSTDLSGILAEIGTETSWGAKAYFETVNAKGGVNGRKIRFVVLDDAYNADKAVENARQLIQRENAVALLGMMGTPANTALIPVVSEAGIPSVGPYTGGQVVRKPLNHMIFNIRASYATEADKIVGHLAARGVTRLGVVYQANAFGKEGLAGAQLAAEKYKLGLTAVSSLANDSSDLDRVVEVMQKADLQSILLVTAGKPSSDFIKAYNKKARGMQYFALSVLASQAAVQALGKDGTGVVVSQVMPYPFSGMSPIVREYQKAMEAAGRKNFSYASMEGFVNAKVLVEALRTVKQDVTRERLADALDGLGKLDLGGFVVNFNRTEHQGSQFVELTVVSNNGRFVR
jgi:ABC-type branched-subunit amino acid transport system substrate-binding protein